MQKNDEKEIILEMRGIIKSFPGVQALDRVDFTLRKGEIHALLGENGAGKSTLIKILTGVEQADDGVIKLEGKQIAPRSPFEAQKNGISTVYQEVNLCPNLSVAENIYLGRAPKKLGRIDWKTMRNGAEKALERVGLKLDVTASLDEYSVAVQQMVAISRAVDISVKILVLDEPTSSLDQHEAESLFHIMRKLRDRGFSIIFITHFLDQVYAVSDRMTILRNGKLVGNYEVEDVSPIQLVGHMIGRDYNELNQEIKKSAVSKEKVTDDMEPYYSAQGIGKNAYMAPFDLDVHRNEIIGFCGLLGSGRTESASLIFGVEKPDTGTVKVDGKTRHIDNPRTAIKSGIGLCPEDRKAQGIIPYMTIKENMILALQVKRGMFKLITPAMQEELSKKYIEMLNIVTPSAEQQIQNLSGGNQQKVMIARWLATSPHVLILDEPTRGIDVGAKAEIQKKILQLAKGDISVIFISSEWEEMLRVCSRMVVFKDKHKIADLLSDEFSQSALMKITSGGKEE